MTRYFPGELWKVGPDPVRPLITDYETCCFGVGWGTTPDRTPMWEEWKRENSLGYLGDGDMGLCNCTQQPYPNPLCLGDPVKRQALIQQFVLPQTKQFKRSVSVTPPDGVVWCDCQLCIEHMNKSDLVAELADDAVKTVSPTHRVCMLAYADWREAPSYIDPSVVVLVTQGEWVSNLLYEWAKLGIRDLGVYVYASVFQWDRGMWGNLKAPGWDGWGNAWAGNPKRMAKDLREWHARGARHTVAECSDDWALNGFGYYTLGQLTRDLSIPHYAVRKKLVGDCFPGLSAMSNYLAFITERPLAGPADIQEAYNLLHVSWKSLTTTDARARIRQLALGVRYVELWLRYMETGAQADFADLCYHAQDSNGMVHANAMPALCAPDGIDKNVHMPSGTGHPMTYSDAEIDAFISEGAAGPEGPPREQWPDYSKGIRCSFDETPYVVPTGDHLFYVPFRSKTIELWAFAQGAVGNPNGDMAFQFLGPRTVPGYHSIPVPSGMDGRMWRVQHSYLFVLLNIPPYLFQHPA